MMSVRVINPVRTIVINVFHKVYMIVQSLYHRVKSVTGRGPSIVWFQRSVIKWKKVLNI